MRKCGALTVTLLTVMLANVSARDLNSDGDFQNWYTFGVSSTSKGWRLRFEDEMHIGNDWHKFYYNYMDLGLGRTLYPCLFASINYRQVDEIKSGEWTKENRPHINGILKWTIGSWSFTDRNRMEFRDFESGQDKWRYRNRFTAYFPVKFFDGRIRPYYSNEMFVDLHGDGLLTDRSYAGLEWKAADWLKTDISYFWNSSYKGSEWCELHVIQLKCDLMF